MYVHESGSQSCLIAGLGITDDERSVSVPTALV